MKYLFFAQLVLYNQKLVLLKFIWLEAFTITEFNKIILGVTSTRESFPAFQGLTHP
jgi:hypothetical protein